MFLAVKDDDDVARWKARSLVALARERDLLLVLHSLVDVDLKDLPLLDNLLAVAGLAAIFLLDLLAAAITLRASRTHLLNHSGTNLS